jgi:hypothetical protein
MIEALSTGVSAPASTGATPPFSLDEIEVTGPHLAPHNPDHSPATKTRHALVKSDTTLLTIPLDAIGRARVETALPKVLASLRQFELDTHGPNHAQVGTVDAAYVLHGAMGVGLNRWRLRPEDLPPPETFEPIDGDRVELVDVLVSDADITDACLLASELNVEVTAVLSCALATGLAKLDADIETRGPFRMPTKTSTET